MSQSRRKDNEGPAFDPMQAWRGVYEQFMQQSAAQWEEVAHDPRFLSAMAAGTERMMDAQAQTREAATALLQAMNLPTKDDLVALAQRLDAVSAELAALNRKVDALLTPAKAKKPKGSTR